MLAPALFTKRAVIRRPMTKLRNSSPAGVSPIVPPQTAAPAETSRSVRNESYLDDPECNSLRERLCDDPSFEDLDGVTLQKLLAHLREFSQDRGMREEYADAARASALAEQVRLELSTRHSQIPHRDVGVEQRTTDDEFEACWAEKYDQFDAATAAKRRELSDRQQQSMAHFEGLWLSQMPEKYRRPSQALLEMKQIERSLAIAGQYERARAVHEDAAQLAASEAELLQGHLIRDYRLARARRLRRQQAERDKLESDRARLRTVLDAQKKLELEQRANREAVVQERISESTKAPRERSGAIGPDYGASVSGSVELKRRFRENIIPRLLAPNDPDFLEEEERRAREKRRQQLEFHKRNADLTLLDYIVQPSPRDDD
jgi:hypothetical protein